MTRLQEDFLTGSTLLLIDDSPVNLKVVSDTLNETGANLIVSTEGEEGLRLAEQEQPDLILLDVVMPGINGIEVCRRLKANPSTFDIPVVFITSLSDTSDKLAAFDAGGIDYLTRPLQFKEVKARINAHLRSRALRLQMEQSNSSLKAEIQERKRLEHILIEQSEFQQSLLNAIRDMRLQIIVVEGGRILHAGNKEMFGELGYTEKMISESPAFAEFIHPDDRSRVMGHYRQRISGGDAPSNYELGLVSVTGERVECEMFVQTIPDSSPIRVVALCRDISERKKMEADLHQREEAFRAMAENSPDMIARYDLDCRLIYTNPSKQKFLEQAVNPETKDRDTDYCTPQTGFRNTLEEVIATGKEAAYTLNWKSVEKQSYWSQIRIVPEFDAAGSIVSVLAIGRDVTDLVEAENQLNDSKQVLRKLLVRQELKHDARETWAAWEVYDSLGQLLMVQRLDIGLLQSDSFADDIERKAHLGKMQGVTDKAISIVRSVSSELRPSAFNMGVSLALEWIIEEFQKHSEIRCELVRIEDDLTLDEAKENMLFHVVQDSLDNIMSQRKADQVRIWLERENDVLVLQIHDNGEGAELGDPNDANLGMYYIQERVHAIGGEVVVFNQPGDGTLLEVRIPLQNEAS